MQQNYFIKTSLVFILFFQGINCADTTYSSNSSLSSDTRLTSSSRAIFDATLTLDGSNFAFTFPHTNDQVLVVNNGFTATLTNILLDRFSPSNLSLGAGSSIIFGNNSYTNIFKDDTLSYTCKFSGTSTLNGRNKVIQISSSGAIEVQASSTLTLKDLTLYDVNNTNLRCLDNSGRIIFDNVKIINRNRWRFQNGSFAVTNNLSMLGGGIFSYESAYASTINDNSTLLFTDNMTFSYDPAKGSGQAVAGQQNLVFTNTSSKLICDGITLKITNTGMRLTNGTIQFDRKNSIYSDAPITDTARSFIFGDKTSKNNPQINIGPDAKLNLETGSIRYENIEKDYLKYGDGILFRHATYGLYLDSFNSSTQDGTKLRELRYLYANPTLYNPDSYYYVQPTDTNTRWGSSLLGKQVLTGDYVKFECFADYGLTGNSFSGYSPTPAGASLSYLNTTEFVPTQILSPTPPYRNAMLLAYSYIFSSGSYNSAYARIFVNGGSVGSAIKKNDVIYLQFVVGSGSVSYMGCRNDTISGSKKEVFHYHTVSQSPPPSFSSYYLWNVEEIISDAYLTSSKYPSSTITDVGSVNLSAVASASNYQF